MGFQNDAAKLTFFRKYKTLIINVIYFMIGLILKKSMKGMAGLCTLWRRAMARFYKGVPRFQNYRFRRTSQMKYGAPARAVMLPTGSSAGAEMVRASVSATNRKKAPKKRE